MKTGTIIFLGWLALIVIFAVSARGEDALTPGGVVPTALNDGSPAVGLDVSGAIKEAKKSDKGFLKTVMDATVTNVSSNRAAWLAGLGSIAIVGASKDVQELIGISKAAGKKVDQVPKTEKPEKQPRPDVYVKGKGNDVTIPQGQTGNGNGIVVIGVDNNVNVVPSGL